MNDTEEKCEKISFVIPCYNSTNTIDTVVQEIKEVMRLDMSRYDYERFMLKVRNIMNQTEKAYLYNLSIEWGREVEIFHILISFNPLYLRKIIV